jgi:hypothetical protein
VHAANDLAAAAAIMISSSSSSEENKAKGIAATKAAKKRPRRARTSAGAAMSGLSSTATSKGQSCCLCNYFDSEFGDLLEADNLRAHYFCLLFASALNQSGQDEDEGLRGFLPAEVRNEVKRGARLKCVYCKRKGATVGCSRTQCKKSYHLPCGIENKSLQQHYGKFQSFCFSHRPAQKPMSPTKAAAARKECVLCLDPIGDAASSSSKLYPGCCSGGWMHRECVQKTASTSGSHHFRCPLCNDARRFEKEMQLHGIHVTTRDAQWELNGSYDEMEGEKKLPCDAKVCFCDKDEARAYDKKDSVWEVS